MTDAFQRSSLEFRLPFLNDIPNMPDIRRSLLFESSSNSIEQFCLKFIIAQDMNHPEILVAMYQIILIDWIEIVVGIILAERIEIGKVEEDIGIVLFDFVSEVLQLFSRNCKISICNGLSNPRI